MEKFPVPAFRKTIRQPRRGVNPDIKRGAKPEGWLCRRFERREKIVTLYVVIDEGKAKSAWPSVHGRNWRARPAGRV